MKKIIASICFLIIILFSKAQTPTFEWAKKMSGTDSDYGRSVAVDTFGNVYTTGWFRGTVDFNPGAGVYNLTSTASAADDVFISKLDASGNFVWAKHIKGPDPAAVSNAYNIKLDQNGNVYVTGFFNGTLDFDPGPGVYNVTSACDSTSETATFLLKLDSFGNFIWVKQLTGFSYTLCFTIDKYDNIYLSGEFLSAVDFDTGAGIFNLTPVGNEDIFIAKFDVSGNFIWVKQIGGSMPEFTHAIEVDKWCNVYITGGYSGTVDFDPGVGVYNLTSGTFNTDICIAKLDSLGNFVWAKQIGNSSNIVDVGHAIEVDALNNVYVTGQFRGTVDFNPDTLGTFNLTSIGSGDAFVLKLNTSGNFIWAKMIGEALDDEGFGIAVDQNGNVYTTGWFRGTVDFNPDGGVFNLTSAGIEDVFVLKLDNSGNFVWALKMGGTLSDKVFAIALDASDNIYTTGWFEGTSDFDPGVGVLNLTSAGMSDIFVHKISQNISTYVLAENINFRNATIYPNPSNGLFNICTSEQIKNGSIEIYNSMGELIYLKETSDQQNLIDLKDHVNGLYFVKVIRDGEVIGMEKIVKH